VAIAILFSLALLTGPVSQAPGTDYLDGLVPCVSTEHPGPPIELTSLNSTLEYSTLIGGDEGESDTFIDIDPSGNIYLAGSTSSSDFPTTEGAFCEELKGRSDLFLMKLTPDGKTILFSTLFGGNQTDTCSGIVVDESGAAFVVGYTHSDDLPITVDAYCQTHSGGYYDVFVAKIAPSGSSLEYSTYLGGEGRDYASDMFVDGSGSVFVVGNTVSDRFPTTLGAFSTVKAGYRDCFVTKIGPGGDDLVFSTFIGGRSDDLGNAVWVKDDGTAFIAGSTKSSDFPTTDDAFAPHVNDWEDGFVSQLAADGSDLEYSTFLGGTEDDSAWDITLDDAGSIYVVGRTNSDDFPTTDGVYFPNPDWLPARRSNVGFVTKMTSTGESLVFSTHIQDVPGNYATFPSHVSVLPSRDIMLGGSTGARTLPTTSEAFSRKSNGNDDTFLMWLASNGSRIYSSSYFGGNDYDGLSGMQITSTGDVLITGRTRSIDFPTTVDALDSTMGGYYDTFLSRLRLVKTSGTPPIPPQNITTEAMDLKIVVSWDPPPDPPGHPVLGYRIYHGPPENMTYVGFQLKDTVEYLDDDVAIGEIYNYTIVALNAIGPSGPATASAIPWAKPSAPRNVTATAQCGSVLLQWSPPKSSGGLPILGYYIFRGYHVGAFVQIAGVGNQTTFIDFNVSKNRTYYYMLRAFHVKVPGPDSKVVGAIPFGVPGPPNNLIATAGDSCVFLVWDHPFSDGGRELEAFLVYGGESDGSLKLIKTIHSFGSMYTHGPLVNGRDYFYMVTARNSAGEGPGTAVVHCKPRGPPGPPVGVFAIPSHMKVELSWLPPNIDGGSGVTAYRVW